MYWLYKNVILKPKRPPEHTKEWIKYIDSTPSAKEWHRINDPHTRWQNFKWWFYLWIELPIRRFPLRFRKHTDGGYRKLDTWLDRWAWKSTLNN